MTDQPAERLTFSAVKDAFDRRIEALPARSQAAFYLWAARGLAAVYQRFAARQQWGDISALHRAIDIADRFTRLGEVPMSGAADDLAEALMSAAPDFDDFDDPDTPGAQDAVIAANDALRVARGDSVPGAAEYVLEHAELAVTFRRTGYTGLGSGPEADAWDREIMSDPSIQAALAAIDAALSALEADRPVDADASALDPA